MQGAAGELEPRSVRCETESWPRDSEQPKITSYQLKGLISPQLGLCVTLRVCRASEGCLRALATLNNLFCFLISPLFKPLSFIFDRSSLHILGLFCLFAPTFGCLTLFAAARWTYLQAPRLFCLRFVWYAGSEESNYSRGIRSPAMLLMPTHRHTLISQHELIVCTLAWKLVVCVCICLFACATVASIWQHAMSACVSVTVCFCILGCLSTISLD